MKENWKISSAVVATLFGVFILAPFIWPTAFPEWIQRTYLGVVHGTSMLYIFFSFLIYFFFGKRYKQEDTAFTLAPNKLKKMADSVRTVTELDEIDEKIVEILNLEKSGSSDGVPIDKITTPIKEGLGADAINLICTQFIEASARRSVYLSRYWAQVSATLPLLGMTGTIAGLLFMFSEGSDSGDKGSQLAGLAVALLTTLYASLITVLIAKPMAKQEADHVDNILNDGKHLSIYGQQLAMQITSHDFENYEQSLNDDAESHSDD